MFSHFLRLFERPIEMFQAIPVVFGPRFEALINADFVARRVVLDIIDYAIVQWPQLAFDMPFIVKCRLEELANESIPEACTFDAKLRSWVFFHNLFTSMDRGQVAGLIGTEGIELLISHVVEADVAAVSHFLSTIEILIFIGLSQGLDLIKLAHYLSSVETSTALAARSLSILVRMINE